MRWIRHEGGEALASAHRSQCALREFELLGNPRFSDGLRPAFLHGKTRVFPTPFQQMVQGLFFTLFVDGLFLAPFAKFLELYFSLNFLFVFSAPVIYSFAITTSEFYELNLFHFDLFVEFIGKL